MGTAFRLPPFPEDPDDKPVKAKKKHRGWRILGWSVLGLVCFLIAAVVVFASLVNVSSGATNGLHKALLKFSQQEVRKMLGLSVRIQNFQVHWLSLSVDVYGITVPGAAPHSKPPLLQVQHVEAGLHIVSIFKRDWYLKSLRIDKPVAWIYVGKNGRSNLPSFKSSSKSSGNNNMLFTIGIRHALLDGGKVYYNSVPKTVYANLHNLNLQAAYTPAQQTYSGTLGYKDGRLRYGAFQPILHTMSMDFKLTPTTLELNHGRLAVGNSTLLLTAAVHHYNHDPAVQVSYHASLDGTQLAQLTGDASIPAGTIRAGGAIHLDDIPGQPILRTLTVNGDLSSPQIRLQTASMSAQVSNLAAHYAVAHGNAALKDFHARMLGGDVTAQGAMTNLGHKNAHSHFTARLHNVSLSQLKRLAAKQPGVKAVRLAGRLNATAEATWGSTMQDLVAQVNAAIHANVSGARHAAGQERSARGVEVASTRGGTAVVPIASEIHVTYRRASGELRLIHSYLRAQGTTLRLNGMVSRHSSLAVRLRAKRLAELTQMMDAFRAPAPNRKPLDLAGTASFHGTVTGSLSAPHLVGQLTALNLRVNQSAWKSVRAGVDVSPDHAGLENAVLVPASNGRIDVTARAGLSKWAFSKQSPIQAEVHASQVKLTALTRFMATPPPVTGLLNTRLQVHGSVANPQGTGNLSLTDATAYQQPVNALRVNFSGDGTQAQANLTAQLPAGPVTAKVVVQPKQRTYTAQVTSPGIHLGELTLMKKRGIKADGLLHLQASGHGSFSNPELAATVQIPALTVSKQKINAVNLQLKVANHVANAALTSSTLNGSIEGQAKVELTGNYMTDAALKTSVLSVKPLLAIYSPSQAQELSGQVQLQATVHGPIKNLKQIQAQVTLPVLNVAYQNKIHLGEVSPIQVNYQDGVLNVLPGGLRGTDTAVTFAAQVPTDRNQPMSLKLNGVVNLQLAQIFNPNLQSGGQLRLQIDSHGPISSGKIGGEIDVVNASFAESTVPVGLQHGNGVLKLTTDRVDIARFEGSVGGGKVQLQGGFAYRPHLTFDLGMSARGIRVLYPQGLRETVGGNIRLSGSTSNALVAGNVNLANLSFTPDFDLTSFAGSFSGGVAPPPSPGSIAQNVHLNLNVRSTNNIDLVSRQLSVNGSANLQVRGTAAQPVILGRIDVTGGDAIVHGDRFLLTGGTIQFINPSETEPVLNLGLTTTIQQYNITMRFRGPARQIHAEYTSVPALPTADVIHLLAFGDTTEAAANNVTPANQQAESLVASQVASQVTSRISRVAGISQLSVSPVLQGGTEQGPPGATVTIRQRVTGNLFITFSTNVASTQDQVIQGEYQISPKVSISATREPNGGFGFDTLIKNSW